MGGRDHMTQRVFTEAELAAGIREVTDDEVAFYEEHGWVKMDRLVDPAIIEVVRKAAEAYLHEHRPGFNGIEGLAVIQKVEPFRSFVFSAGMSRMAHRLINRKRLTDVDVPTRI